MNPGDVIFFSANTARQKANVLGQWALTKQLDEWAHVAVSLYPKDPDGATPIAYLWARTVRSESPNCGAEIPLVRSFGLCMKVSRKRALQYSIERLKGQRPRVKLDVFEPKSDKDVPGATVTRAKARCICCGVVLPPERVRAQIAAQRGGADVVFDDKGLRVGGARMLAVVMLRPGESGRHYRLPTDRDYAAVRMAQERLAKLSWRRAPAGPVNKRATSPSFSRSLPVSQTTIASGVGDLCSNLMC